MAYSPPASPYRGAPSPSAYVPSLPRSVSTPSPSTAASAPRVITADDFDLRFGAAPTAARTDSVSDETALGTDFSRNRAESVSEDVEMIDDNYNENGELMNQKGKSGLFSFGNKAKKLK